MILGCFFFTPTKRCWTDDGTNVWKRNFWLLIYLFRAIFHDFRGFFHTTLPRLSVDGNNCVAIARVWTFRSLIFSLTFFSAVFRLALNAKASRSHILFVISSSIKHTANIPDHDDDPSTRLRRRLSHLQEVFFLFFVLREKEASTFLNVFFFSLGLGVWAARVLGVFFVFSSF